MELLPTVHEHSGEPTGLHLSRAEAIANKAWCMSTNVFILNRHGQILCHQRSLLKERYPGAWCTHVGGHVGAEETFETNAMKELEEEAGVSILPSQMIPWRTTRIEVSKLWTKEFVVYLDADVSHFTPQEGEVEQFAWKTPEEILRGYMENPGEWLAGTHDFAAEYQCLRAALTTAHNLGQVTVPTELLRYIP